MGIASSCATSCGAYLLPLSRAVRPTSPRNRLHYPITVRAVAAACRSRRARVLPQAACCPT